MSAKPTPITDDLLDQLSDIARECVDADDSSAIRAAVAALRRLPATADPDPVRVLPGMTLWRRTFRGLAFETGQDSFYRQIRPDEFADCYAIKANAEAAAQKEAPSITPRFGAKGELP